MTLDWLADLRGTLLDRLLLLLAVVGFPAAIMGVVHTSHRETLGPAPVYFLAYFSVLFGVFTKRVFSYKFRGSILLISLTALSAVALAGRGLAGSGDILLATCCVLATVMFGLRIGILMAGVSMCLFSIVGYIRVCFPVLLDQGALLQVPDGKSWIRAGLILLVLMLTIVLSPGILQEHLLKALALVTKRTREAERAKTELIAEVQQRRKTLGEKRELEAQLLQAQKLEAVGRLAGGVAHDFNNLLTGIIGHVTMARRKIGSDHPAGAHMDEIESTATRTAELTKQLLAFSRKQVIDLKAVDLNGVIERLPAMLGRLLGEDIALQLAPRSETGFVLVDAGQLELIIVNLAVNARDAMPNGGSLLIATDDLVCSSNEPPAGHEELEPGDYVLLSVSDTGTGMPTEVVEHIFEPFYTTKPIGKGTGLGLSSVYGIVRQHRGSIFVSSEPGQGTRFEIALPRARGDEEAVGQNPAPQLPVVGGTETILLVEDDPFVRTINTDLLRDLGYRVLSAASGPEAIHMADQHGEKIEVLLTDVIMPGMNGRELAERLVSSHKDLKVIFASGYTSEVIGKHGVLEAGVHFLSKPFHLAELSSKIRAVLESDENDTA